MIASPPYPAASEAGHPAADAAMLGATLYVPATRGDLIGIAIGARYPDLRSVVFDLEDAVLERDTGHALANIAALLRQMAPVRAHHPDGPRLFIRPRNAEMLARLTHLPGVQAIDGFVIPKATADVLPAYIAAMPHPQHSLMPTIETREAFDPAEMRRLREQLIALHHRVLCIRIGGNDLLQTLGARRSRVRTAYDGPLGNIIAVLVSAFVPWGFAMSAPVLENFSDEALLQAEIDRDLEHGLMTKTAIHPAQVAMIHQAYRVEPADLATAHAILDEAAPAVFADAGTMCEPATHRGWAAVIARRAALYGVRHDPAPLALVS